MIETKQSATSRQEVKMSLEKRLELQELGWLIDKLRDDLYTRIDETIAKTQELAKKYNRDRLAKVVEELDSTLDNMNDAIVEAEALHSEIIEEEI